MKIWMTLSVLAVVNIGLGCSLCGWSESEWYYTKNVYFRVFPLIVGYELFILLLAWSSVRQVRFGVR